MELTEKQIKQIEELTGFKYEEDLSLAYSDEDKNGVRQFKYFFFDEPMLDNDGEETGEGMKELRILGDRITYKDNSVFMEEVIGLPIKLLKPLSEILEGGHNE